jgi:hypothetical protein
MDTTTGEETDLHKWVLKLLLLFVSPFVYLILGYAGAHFTLGGLPLITLVASASVVAATFQWWFFSIIAPSPNTYRHHAGRLQFVQVNRRRSWVLLAFAVVMGSACNGAAALLIRDTRILDETFSSRSRPFAGKPPRLYEPIVVKAKDAATLPGGLRLSALQQRHLERILDTLSRHDVVNDEDLKQTRKSMEILTLSDQHNIVSLNLCRSGWYICLCCVCLGITVFGIGKRCGELVLTFVLAAYLAIGTVFGLIYYDYLLLDAGRYHLLINTLFVDNARDLKEAITKCDECEPLRAKLAQFQSKADNYERILGLMSSGYFFASLCLHRTRRLSRSSDPQKPSSWLSRVTTNSEKTSRESDRQTRLPTVTTPASSPNSSGVIVPVTSSPDSTFAATHSKRTSSRRFGSPTSAVRPPAHEENERDYILRITAAADCTGRAERTTATVSTGVGPHWSKPVPS